MYHSLGSMPQSFSKGVAPGVGLWHGVDCCWVRRVSSRLLFLAILEDDLVAILGGGVYISRERFSLWFGECRRDLCCESIVV
mmetsp:Transcript_1347/g.1977  ORF Transcript_1347/g.1977 Transcript_1347/m.1977 type:complete len:82 (+) Transcript_1347:268-513(+)